MKIKLLSIQELEAYKSRRTVAVKVSKSFEIENQKWIEKWIITFEDDNKQMYIGYYDVFDQQIEEICYYTEGYISDNFFEIKQYYDPIWNWNFDL